MVFEEPFGAFVGSSKADLVTVRSRIYVVAPIEVGHT